MAQKQIKKSRHAVAASATGNTSTPILIALAAGLAGLFWWKSQQNRKTETAKSKSSPFKFPTAKTKSAASTASAASSSLPRNKASNNKKNKARKAEEKQRKIAEKAAAAAPAAKASTSSSSGNTGEEGQPSTAVINYTYFDTARRDTLLPVVKKPTLTAADVMKKETPAP